MAGRPRKYETVEELQEAIDKYFLTEREHLTITGLALALDFSSRRDLLNYVGYSGEFLHAIKKAKLRVENFYERQLIKPNNSGAIFALKNFDWSDKTEHSFEGDNININLISGSKH